MGYLDLGANPANMAAIVSLSFDATPALTGVIRLSSVASGTVGQITVRNSANSADLNFLRMSSGSNNFLLGDTSSQIYIYATQINLQQNAFTFEQSCSAPVIAFNTINGDNATKPIQIRGQNATGPTNVNGGDIQLQTGAKTGAGTNGYVDFVNSPTATTVGAAGGASALPATPTGYLLVKIAGTAQKIPYYAT